MPHLTGLGDDNAARLTYLASYGYVVVAFNDIAQDNAVPAGAPEDQGGSLFTWRMTTQADYDHFLSLTDARVKRQAEKALSGLDRLAACANENVASPWSATIDYAHVGFLGYSFGGATAAEAAAMDPRIVAVASLDGALYGQAFAGHLAVPYLYVLSGRAQPAMKSMMSDDPQERYFARLDARDLRAQARLVARKGSAGIRVDGSPHTSFSDAALEPHLSRLWLFKNPIEFSNAVDLYTRDFFDARLRKQSPALIEKRSSQMPRVLTFNDMGMAQDGNLAWLPAQDAAGAPLP
jgi:dienelactone hydrolase